MIYVANAQPTAQQDSLSRLKSQSDSAYFAQKGFILNQQDSNLNNNKAQLSDESIISTLSLVDKKIFDNWEEELGKIKSQYNNTNLLVTVSAHDSEQRTTFVSIFYEKMMFMDIEKAYLKAIRFVKKQFNSNLDFKYYFHKMR
ncbi:MAG: hypothetical protein EAZ55_04305 [Cytophagales bacterium]|nr:MAG: hypothetical protein EAZ55_04305 [Cytophagales bacterium]